MKYWKRGIALFLAGTMMFAIGGCGKTEKDTEKSTAKNTEPIKIATKPMTEQYILGEILKQGTMMFAIGGCGKTEKDTEKSTAKNTEPIKIATKPMTEQYILGEILKQLIEDKTEYKVEVTAGIGGGTSNIHPAMEKGEFDLYPEYTASGWVMVLGHEAGEVSEDKLFEELKKEYQDKFQMTWVGLYGFNNTYALAVRKDVADQYQLKTCSDLAEVSGNEERISG